MPVYTMKCAKCNNQWDITRSMNEAPTEKTRLRCPSCQSLKTRRVFKAAQVIPDTYDHPVAVSTLLPVRTNDRSVQDVVRSRSELKQLMRDHDSKYGTRLVQAG